MNHTFHKIKTANSNPKLLSVINERWSPRAFSEQAVELEKLELIFEAGRWAASSNNEQPWRFYLGIRQDEVWQAIFDSLVPFNQQWCAPVPVLILSIAREQFTKNGDTNRHALHDVGQAFSYMALQATDLGLYTHQMAGYDIETATRLLEIPEGFTPATVMAVGYAGDPSTLKESHAESEAAPRSRKSLTELVFGTADQVPFDWKKG